MSSQIALSGIDLTLGREEPTSWRAQFRIGPGYVPLGPASHFPAFQNNAGARQDYDQTGIATVARDLSNAMYIPSTRVAIGQSQGDAYDLQFGRSFIALWNGWKTGPNRSQNDAIQRVTEDIASLFGFRRLEVSMTPDGSDLHVAIDGKSFKLRELGGGLAQFLIVLANAATRKPSLLLIDEPEIGLHPSLQLDFVTTLASYASGATLFATHSLGLARSADRVLSLKSTNGQTVCKDFEETPSFQEFLGEMSFAAYRDLGFDSVLMVEGVNDIKTAQQLLRLLGKERRVVVLQLGGSQMIRTERAQELSEVLRLTKAVHVLIDSEKPDAQSPLSSARADFLAACATLGIKAIATERRAMEHYMADAAVKQAFGRNYRALGPFENRTSVQPMWAKSESWRAARLMTEKELLDTDVGKFLQTV